MAESKILTRGEIEAMFSEAIPDCFKADGWVGEFSTLNNYFYGDNDYNPDRCASKITSTFSMEEFLREYVGTYVEVLATPESLSNYTFSLGDGQLIPENSILDPRLRLSGGQFNSVHYYNTTSLTTTSNNGIEIALNFFIGSGTYKRIIYRSNVLLTNIGSSYTNDTYSFITSNSQDIGIELIYSNVSSANITELTLSNNSNSISIPLTKLSEDNTKSVFTAFINKIQMDTLLSTNNLRFTIKGSLVGTAQPDVPYTFDLTDCYQLVDTSINLTSFYGKGSTQVRLAYDAPYLSDAYNEIILYSNNWTKLWSTTQATLNNFVLTVPNIHAIATEYSDSYQYFFLKVPFEFYNSYSGGWTRTVLYYPLTLNMYYDQYLQLQAEGVLYLGMCNYHTTTGEWKWVLGNSAQYTTAIYLPDHGTNATITRPAEVTAGNSAQFSELTMPCTHLIYLQAYSNYNNLRIHAEGNSSYIRFGTTKTRVKLIPNTVTTFETLVGYLNQNESENITYELTRNQEY